MFEKYRLMIYFALGTMYFYRKDIIPRDEGETLDSFYKKNEVVRKRVSDEATNLFGYELSSEQMGKAFLAYLAPSQSVAGSEPATMPTS